MKQRALRNLVETGKMERAKVRNLNENQQDRQAVTVHQVEGKCQIYVYTYCKLTFMFYVSVPEVVLPLQAVVVVVAQARGHQVAAHLDPDLHLVHQAVLIQILTPLVLANLPTRVTRRKGNQKIYIPFNSLINFFTFLKEVQQ